MVQLQLKLYMCRIRPICIAMLLVADIAEALEDCTRISSLDGKREVLRILFEKCANDVDATEDLLRVLLPSEVCCIYNGDAAN